MKRIIGIIMAIVIAVTGITVTQAETASAGINGGRVYLNPASNVNNLLVCYDWYGQVSQGTKCAPDSKKIVIHRGQTATCPHDGGRDCDGYWIGPGVCTGVMIGNTFRIYKRGPFWQKVSPPGTQGVTQRRC